MFNCFKPKTADFSQQTTFQSNEISCSKHGPINFIREDFDGCIECNDKWRSVMYPRLKTGK